MSHTALVILLFPANSAKTISHNIKQIEKKSKCEGNFGFLPLSKKHFDSERRGGEEKCEVFCRDAVEKMVASNKKKRSFAGLLTVRQRS